MINKDKSHDNQYNGNSDNSIEENEEIKNTSAHEEESLPEPHDTEITHLEEELSQTKDKLLRLYSDFENYKKRMLKERIEMAKMAGEDIFGSLLPILDDLDRALKSIEESSDVKSIKEGVNLISNKLKNTLIQKGLREMEIIDKSFDSDLHEAVTNIPVEDKNLKGKVVDVVEKGYFLNDKVLRHAKVIVGS